VVALRPDEPWLARIAPCFPGDEVESSCYQPRNLTSSPPSPATRSCHRGDVDHEPSLVNLFC